MAKALVEQEPAPVLAIGLGRGASGKSTLLMEAVWRARNQGRDPIVADGDTRSRTLTALFPDASQPSTEETADGKAWITSLLNRAVKEKRSVVLVLGGGDKLLMDYGRDLQLVAFCARRGIEPLALFVMGPEAEDLRHCLAIYEAGFFKPKRMVIVLNEGVIRAGFTLAGAFEPTMGDPGFQRMVAEGAVPILLNRLPCMTQVRSGKAGFYGAASGEAGLDPVEEFLCESWLADLEEKRAKAGAASWWP
jgi:hypothetical protein